MAFSGLSHSGLPVTVVLSRLRRFYFDAAIGVIIGGRLGYMLFYSQGQWWHDPLTIIRVWEGGMSFHGGLCGNSGSASDIR